MLNIKWFQSICALWVSCFTCFCMNSPDKSNVQGLCETPQTYHQSYYTLYFDILLFLKINFFPYSNVPLLIKCMSLCKLFLYQFIILFQLDFLGIIGWSFIKTTFAEKNFISPQGLIPCPHEHVIFIPMAICGTIHTLTERAYILPHG